MMRIGEPGRPAIILLVEDSEDDALIARKSFDRACFIVDLHHVANGRDCMAFLHKQGEFAEAPTPDLILLDLNMPIMDGREVLAEIVKDERLRRLPVVVLTTSANESDVLQTYQLRCSSYIVKPVEFSKFEKVVAEIGKYWFNIVFLPREDH